MIASICIENWINQQRKLLTWWGRASQYSLFLCLTNTGFHFCLFSALMSHNMPPRCCTSCRSFIVSFLVTLLFFAVLSQSVPPALFCYIIFGDTSVLSCFVAIFGGTCPVRCVTNTPPTPLQTCLFHSPPLTPSVPDLFCYPEVIHLDILLAGFHSIYRNRIFGESKWYWG